ncbi:hypothetical protein AAEU32_02620 [Pseudoalteromonas sp. SSDWG2]|uniref:hypothetical protein n=1 Tax=Pseudoalteromonas sp. SSDWG2 TaxID=3139391 RepID=UPI003BAC65BF
MRFLFVLTVLLASHASAAPHQFLVFGDMPYSAVDEALMRAPDGQLYQAVRQTPHLFVAHVGDIKAGGVPCTDEVLQHNFNLISAISTQPLVYTPGDNEWTDCDRDNLHPKFDELERLAYVRDNFTKHAVTLPQFVRQSEQTENQAWRIDDVQYITLHVVGTNNARAQVYMSQPDTALEQVQLRDAKNLQWLAQHTKKKAKATVIFMQADLYQKANYGLPCTSTTQRNCDGLSLYKNALDKLASTHDTPVLLVHGDTAEFCFSQRSSGLWHMNSPGDYRVSDIAKVVIDTKASKVFSVATLLSKGLIRACPSDS